MDINTNMSSLVAQNNLNNTQSAMQSALAQLSSGYRINQASDDAAGYAITQKMSGQVQGLNQATQNAQNTISLTQTAQGALNESENILQRMRVLAVQSASDTSTDSDRQQIQLETNQLATELSQISNTTEFNTKNLLSGSFQNQTFQIGANQDQNIKFSVGAMDAFSLGVASNGNVSLKSDTPASTTTGVTSVSMMTTSPLSRGVTYNLTATDVTGNINSINLNDTSKGIGNVTIKQVASSTLASGNYTIQVAVNGTTGTTAGLTLVNSNGVAIATATVSAGTADGNVKFTIGTGTGAVTGISLSLSGIAAGIANHTGTTQSINFTNDANSMTFNLTGGGQTVDTVSGVSLGTQTSVFLGNSGLTVNLTGGTGYHTAGTYAVSNIQVTGVSSTAAKVGINGTVLSGATVQFGVLMNTQARANQAITTINNAINTVATQLAQLGAVQNRLSDSVTNLGVSSQNLTAAEGNIKDVDMAAEMSQFTQDQVLSQAGVAMLAQANQVPQMILKLLQ